MVAQSINELTDSRKGLVEGIQLGISDLRFPWRLDPRVHQRHRAGRRRRSYQRRRKRSGNEFKPIKWASSSLHPLTASATGAAEIRSRPPVSTTTGASPPSTSRRRTVDSRGALGEDRAAVERVDDDRRRHRAVDGLLGPCRLAGGARPPARPPPTPARRAHHRLPPAGPDPAAPGRANRRNAGAANGSRRPGGWSPDR